MVNPKQTDRTGGDYTPEVDAIVGLSKAFTIGDGNAETVEARGARRVVVIPKTGATVTVSKVDAEDASSHDSDTSQDVTSETAFAVSWPFYRISTVGADCRVAVV